MAIVGSFVAYGVNRLIAGNSAVQSRRRVVAAAIAGYVSINAAALIAAIEFGIQPLFFTAADGTPLYAPYPIMIAVPAMMIGHLTFAGLAEMILTGGIVAYLQRAEPSLLGRDAGLAVRPSSQRIWRTRPLWAALGVLMIATPLGLLAAGTAWGEWSAEDFTNPALRSEIQNASLRVPPPNIAPAGLARIASIWTAPIPDYAPAFIRSSSFGYALSALFGAGLVIVTTLLLRRIGEWGEAVRGRDSA
jgi:cobalt/nickel transport system permease protein